MFSELLKAALFSKNDKTPDNPEFFLRDAATDGKHEECGSHRDREKEIRDRAYYKWLDAGSPWGREMEFWLEAEKELASDHDED